MPTPPKAIPLMKPLQPTLDLLKEAKLAQYTKSLGGVKNYTTQRQLEVPRKVASLPSNIEIQLQRMAMASVPNRPSKQPLKSKSPYTADMIEQFKRKEQQDIRSRGFIQGEGFEVKEVPESFEDYYGEDLASAKRNLENQRTALGIRHQAIEAEVVDINAMISDYPERARDPAVVDELQELANASANIQAEIARLGERSNELDNENAFFEAGRKKVRQANAQAIRNYEDMLRLLNQELPIQQMVGESDAEYRERLISYRNETVDDADGTEARLYEHKRFKKFLAEIITLPLYQVELLIKELDDKGDERVYQLNEIWPKIKSSFEKVYGLNPRLRDPVQSLYDFMIGVLSNPSDSPEAYAQVVEGRELAQAVEAGTIDPSLEKLTKKQVLVLLKEAGLSRGLSNKRVTDLKMLYTEYLRRT